MIRIPDKSSWTNAFKLEDFFAVDLPALMRVHLDKPHAEDHQRQADQGSRCENRIFEKHDHDDGADCEKIRDQRRDAVAEYVL